MVQRTCFSTPTSRQQALPEISETEKLRYQDKHAMKWKLFSMCICRNLPAVHFYSDSLSELCIVVHHTLDTQRKAIIESQSGLCWKGP